MVINKYLAELVGTFILVVVGSMSILAAQMSGAPVLVVVPFGFGLGLLIAIYAVGHVSGGHFNPAVTLAMWLDKRTTTSDLIGYWIGQIVGAMVASMAVLALSSQADVAKTITGFGTHGSGVGLLSEIILTLVFVMVILVSTRTAVASAPLVISLALAGVHFAGIPFSGSSVNPARSFGPALIGGDFSGYWVYVVGPLVGGAIAWVLWRLFPAKD